MICSQSFRPKAASIAAADILLMPYSRLISVSSGQDIAEVINPQDIAEVINPMKMFEYMASGQVIVSADLPSIREVLNEGNAVFCPARESGNWRLAIESLLGDEPRRRELGTQAREDVGRFTWVKREERVMLGFTDEEWFLVTVCVVVAFKGLVFLGEHFLVPIYTSHFHL